MQQCNDNEKRACLSTATRACRRVLYGLEATAASSGLPPRKGSNLVIFEADRRRLTGGYPRLLRAPRFSYAAVPAETGTRGGEDSGILLQSINDEDAEYGGSLDEVCQSVGRLCASALPLLTRSS